MSISSIIEEISANQDTKIFKILGNTRVLINKIDIPAGSITYSSNLEKFMPYINNNKDVVLGEDISFDDTIVVQEGEIVVLEVGLGKDFSWIKFKKTSSETGVVLYGLCPESSIVPSVERLVSPESFKLAFEVILNNGGTGTSQDKATPKTLKIKDITADVISEEVVFDKNAATYATVIKTDLFKIINDADTKSKLSIAYKNGVKRILEAYSRKRQVSLPSGINSDIEDYYIGFSKIYDYYINPRPEIPLTILVALPERFLIAVTEIQAAQQDEIVNSFNSQYENLTTTSGAEDNRNALQKLEDAYDNISSKIESAVNVNNLVPSQITELFASVDNFDGDPDFVPGGLDSLINGDLFIADTKYMKPETVSTSLRRIKILNKEDSDKKFQKLIDIFDEIIKTVQKETKANKGNPKVLYRVDFAGYKAKIVSAKNKISKILDGKKANYFYLYFDEAYVSKLTYVSDNAEVAIPDASFQGYPFSDRTLNIFISNLDAYTDELSPSDQGSITGFLEKYVYPESLAVVVPLGETEEDPGSECLKNWKDHYKDSLKAQTDAFINETNLQENIANIKASFNEAEWQVAVAGIKNALDTSIDEYNWKSIDWEYVIIKGTECVGDSTTRDSIRFLLRALKAYLEGQPLECLLPLYALPKFPSFRLPKIPKLQSIVQYFFDQLANEAAAQRAEAIRFIVQSLLEILQICETEQQGSFLDNLDPSRNSSSLLGTPAGALGQSLEQQEEQFYDDLLRNNILIEGESSRAISAQIKILIDETVKALSDRESVRLFLGIPTDIILETTKAIISVQYVAKNIDLIIKEFLINEEDVSVLPGLRDITSLLDEEKIKAWYQKFGPLLRPDVLDSIQVQLSQNPDLLCLPRNEIETRIKDALKAKGLSDEDIQSEIERRNERLKQATDKLASAITLLSQDAIVGQNNCSTDSQAAKFGRPKAHEKMTETTVTRLFNKFEKIYDSDLKKWVENAHEKTYTQILNTAVVPPEIQVIENKDFLLTPKNNFLNKLQNTEIFNNIQDNLIGEIYLKSELGSYTLSDAVATPPSSNPYANFSLFLPITADPASNIINYKLQKEETSYNLTTGSQEISLGFSSSGKDFLAAFIDRQITAMDYVLGGTLNIATSYTAELLEKIRAEFKTQVLSKTSVADLINSVKEVLYRIETNIGLNAFFAEVEKGLIEISINTRRLSGGYFSEKFASLADLEIKNIISIFLNEPIYSLYNSNFLSAEQIIEKIGSLSEDDLAGMKIKNIPGINYVNGFPINLQLLYNFALGYNNGLPVPGYDIELLKFTLDKNINLGDEITKNQKIGVLSFNILYNNGRNTIKVFEEADFYFYNGSPDYDIFNGAIENNKQFWKNYPFETAIVNINGQKIEIQESFKTFEELGGSFFVGDLNPSNLIVSSPGVYELSGPLADSYTITIYASIPGAAFKEPRKQNQNAALETIKINRKLFQKLNSTSATKFNISSSIVPPLPENSINLTNFNKTIANGQYVKSIKDDLSNSFVFKKDEILNIFPELRSYGDAINEKVTYYNILSLNPPYTEADRKCGHPDLRMINVLQDILNNAMESSADMACYVPNINNSGIRTDDSPTEKEYIFGIYQLLFRLFAIEYNLILSPFYERVRFIKDDSILNTCYSLIENSIKDSSVFGNNASERQIFIDQMYLFLSDRYIKEKELKDVKLYEIYTDTTFRLEVFKYFFKPHFNTTAAQLRQFIKQTENTYLPAPQEKIALYEKINNATSLEEYEFYRSVDESNLLLNETKDYFSYFSSQKIIGQSSWVYSTAKAAPINPTLNTKSSILILRKSLTPEGVAGYVVYSPYTVNDLKGKSLDYWLNDAFNELRGDLSTNILVEKNIYNDLLVRQSRFEEISLSIYAEGSSNYFNIETPQYNFIYSDVIFDVENTVKVSLQQKGQEVYNLFLKYRSEGGDDIRQTVSSLNYQDIVDLKNGIVGSKLQSLYNNFVLFHKYYYPLEKILSSVLGTYLLSVASIDKMNESFDMSKTELVNILKIIKLSQNYTISPEGESLMAQIMEDILKKSPRMVEALTRAMDPNMALASAASSLYEKGIKKLIDKEVEVPLPAQKIPAIAFGIPLSPLVIPNPIWTPLGWTASVWNYFDWLSSEREKNKGKC